MAGAEALSTESGGWLLYALGGAVLLAALFTGIRCVHYRLGRHEFEVLFLGLVIRRVFLKDIEAVVVGARFPAEFWPSRWVLGGGRLTLRRKRGLVRYLTVTPKDAEQLRVNLCYALGWKP